MSSSAKQRPRRVTSIDVAERAGVSQSTVSRALAGSETITPATRRRVELAAEELGELLAAEVVAGRRKAKYPHQSVNPYLGQLESP